MKRKRSSLRFFLFVVDVFIAATTHRRTQHRCDVSVCVCTLALCECVVFV